MNRILLSVLTMGSMIFGRRLLDWLADRTNGDPGAQTPGRRGFFPLLVDRVLGAFGVEEIDTLSFSLLVVAAILCATMIGWTFHVVLGGRGFGPTLNGLIGFSSAVGAVLLVLLVVPAGFAFTFASLMFIGGFGASVVLFGLAFARKAALDRADGYLRGEWSLGDSKNVAANRREAVVRRRR